MSERVYWALKWRETGEWLAHGCWSFQARDRKKYRSLAEARNIRLCKQSTAIVRVTVRQKVNDG